ncbi:MAG: hypothetical protein U5M23_01380 [Marinagarivorans sp.]|nr:hypothetical protein [Marinagarivorans sp.]
MKDNDGGCKLKILHLTINRKWFNMIKSGQKEEEYLEIKDYWAQQLISFSRYFDYDDLQEIIENMRCPLTRHSSVSDLMSFFNIEFKSFDIARFKNGYAKNAETFDAKIQKITIAQGDPELGAEHIAKYYFVIYLDPISVDEK